MERQNFLVVIPTKTITPFDESNILTNTAWAAQKTGFATAYQTQIKTIANEVANKKDKNDDNLELAPSDKVGRIIKQCSNELKDGWYFQYSSLDKKQLKDFMLHMAVTTIKNDSNLQFIKQLNETKYPVGGISDYDSETIGLYEDYCSEKHNFQLAHLYPKGIIIRRYSQDTFEQNQDYKLLGGNTSTIFIPRKYFADITAIKALCHLGNDSVKDIYILNDEENFFMNRLGQKEKEFILSYDPEKKCTVHMAESSQELTQSLEARKSVPRLPSKQNSVQYVNNSDNEESEIQSSFGYDSCESESDEEFQDCIEVTDNEQFEQLKNSIGWGDINPQFKDSDKSCQKENSILNQESNNLGQPSDQQSNEIEQRVETTTRSIFSWFSNHSPRILTTLGLGAIASYGMYKYWPQLTNSLGSLKQSLVSTVKRFGHSTLYGYNKILHDLID